ncbi:DUF4446 family protein [Candidatus Microgenomates bacterium]|jgi:hypothetical protein|nr:MAG: DUF4446 family protein [Candidatus Microgenomates bacterium]
MTDFSSSTLLVLTLVVFAWLGAITFLLVRIYRTFSRLTKGASDKDLKTLLEELLGQVKKNQEKDTDLEKSLLETQKEALLHIQKVGLIRYNPFADTGGNQSFVLALLDGNNNGVVITSLHSRESTRVFSKPVIAGKESEFEFSKEEVQAISEAQKKK